LALELGLGTWPQGISEALLSGVAAPGAFGVL